MFLVDKNPDSATRFYQLVDAEHFFRESNRSAKKESVQFRKIDGVVIISIAKVLGAFLVSLTNRRQPWFLFRLGNVEIGKAINATLLREVQRAHLSRVSYILNYIRYLLVSCFVVAYAARNNKNVVGLSLDNVFYWNGILVDYFLEKTGVWVYLHLPHFGKLCVQKNFDNLSALMKHLEDDACLRNGEPSQAAVYEYMDKRLSDPRNFGLLLEPSEDQVTLSTQGKETNVVVYAHSFADAQMERGWDGFRCVSDWLLFTVEKLSKLNPRPRIFVKAHPNFFVGQSGWTAPEFDRSIWQSIEKRIQSKCFVVSGSTPNNSFLSKFDPKNTVLISHHGNAIAEGAYMGFRTISSGTAIWGRDYAFSANWLSKAEYGALIDEIDSLPELSQPNFESLTKFISDFYMLASSDNDQQRDLQNIIAEELKEQGFGELPSTAHLPYPLDKIKSLLAHLTHDNYQRAILRFSDVVRIVNN